jgi:hypothetical protein
MEKISWIDCAGNEGVLHRLKEHRNSLHKTKKVNCISHILCTKCLVKHNKEGKIQGKM